MSNHGQTHYSGKHVSRRMDTASKVVIVSLTIVALIAIILYATGVLDYASPVTGE